MSGSRSRLSVFRRLAGGLALVLALTPGPMRGQVGGDCEVPRHNGFVTISLSNGSRITYFSSPTIVCGGNTRISADSAVVYEATNYTQLFRHVVFEDGESRLTADQAHYFDQERRLRAWGQVILRDLEEGSIIRGDTMVLLRAGPGRPEDELTVLGTRPRATLYPTRQPIPADSAGLEEGGGLEPSRPDTSVAVPPDTSGLRPPDTARVVPPDTSAVGPPDTAMVALPRDTSAVRLPDTAMASPPDTGAVSPRDTSAVRLPDTAVVSPPDTGAVASRDTSAARVPDTVMVAPPARGAPLPPPASRGRSAPVSQEDRTPYEVQARRMFLEGSRYFRAVGAVTVTRDSVNAEADSLEYDETAGALFLARDARMKTGAYDLSANTIRLDIPQDEIRGVLAREDALLEGQDLWLLAPAIHLLLDQGKVQRLSAMGEPQADSVAAEEAEAPRRQGPGRLLPPQLREKGIEEFPERPHALAEDFLLWADSLEVIAPEETLDEVWAIGNARGESMARDSLNTPDTPELIRRDWLEGDTIVAIFVPADSAQGPEGAEADSASYRLDRLVARVGARSLYRLAATDSTQAPDSTRAVDRAAEGEEAGEERMAIHYVTGDEITIVMKEGEVERMEVAGDTHGIHMEPVAEGRRGVVPDTTAVPPTGRSGGGR